MDFHDSSCWLFSSQRASARVGVSAPVFWASASAPKEITKQYKDMDSFWQLMPEAPRFDEFQIRSRKPASPPLANQSLKLNQKRKHLYHHIHTCELFGSFFIYGTPSVYLLRNLFGGYVHYSSACYEAP